MVNLVKYVENGFGLFCKVIVTGSLICLAPSSVIAEGAESGEETGYLTFYLDNDLFAGTDENYTNGGRLSYVSEGKPVVDIPFVQKFLKRFSAEEGSDSWTRKIWGFENDEDVEYSYGFALTQLMFTPSDPATSLPAAGERPYAGWLGLGLSLHVRDQNTLNSVELSIGTTGKYAYAEATQDWVHDIRGKDKFRGWDSQLPSEPTLNLSFDQRRRGLMFDDVELPFDLEIDGFTDTGYSLGNFLSEAHIGGTVRIGWNLPIEFSDPRLSITSHTQKLYSQNDYNKHKISGYAIFGVRASAVLHDITLDGPLFRDYDTGVDKEYLIGEYYFGLGVRYDQFELGYVQTYRSRQYKTQDKSQSFGSIALRMHF